MIATLDWETEHLALVKDGTIPMLAGQKRELFTWYGAQFLYDMVHQNKSPFRRRCPGMHHKYSSNHKYGAPKDHEGERG